MKPLDSQATSLPTKLKHPGCQCCQVCKVMVNHQSFSNNAPLVAWDSGGKGLKYHGLLSIMHAHGAFDFKPVRSNFKTRIDVYETLCPQQMLVHKGGKIKNWVGECRDVTPTKLQSQNIFKEHWGGLVGGVSGWM